MFDRKLFSCFSSIVVNKTPFSCYNVYMATVEQQKNAKDFSEYWKDKRAEKQESTLR
mgnify:FL=1